MSDEDYRQTLDDHAYALSLAKEGLEQPEALKLFLIAVGKAILELDDSDDCKSQKTRFLKVLDLAMEDVVRGSGPPVVKAVRDFRRILGQHLDEMLMYRRPSN